MKHYNQHRNYLILCAVITFFYLKNIEASVLLTDYTTLVNVGTYFEGPCLRGNKLVFADISLRFPGPLTYPKPASVVYQYNVGNGNLKVIRSPSDEVTGTTLDEFNRIIMFEGANLGGRKVSRFDPATGLTETVTWEFTDANYDLVGKHFNSPNDGIVDFNSTNKRILFTDPRYFGTENMELPLQSVYSVDPTTGISTRIITDAVKPNGIALSPDATILYIGKSDNANYQLLTFYPTGPRQDALLAYPYNPVTGTVGPVNVLVDLTANEPGVWIDGIRTGSNGNIYAAVSGSPLVPAGFRVYRPNGSLKARFELPPNMIASNLVLGKGQNKNFLFLTGANFTAFAFGQPSGLLMKINISSIL